MTEPSWGSRLLGLGATRLVLASASPRRAALLTQVGVPFETRTVEVEEILEPGEAPARAAVRLAGMKAQRAARPGEEAFVLGADTLVVLEGRALGKPAHAEEARTMLRALSGRAHEVVTGVALLRERDGAFFTGYERSRVRFRELLDEDVEALVESGEAMDKAGAYGIQGLAALAVDGLEGDYTNVVGLPLGLVRRLVREAAGRTAQVSVGRLVAIWIKRAHRGSMDAVTTVGARAGQGLLGNADQGSRRQVTLIEEEVWRSLMDELQGAVDPSARRANLLVRGLPLAGSAGRTLRVGALRILVRGETRPCERMDEALSGLRSAMARDGRGGVHGEVLNDGQIQIGDEVSWEVST